MIELEINSDETPVSTPKQQLFVELDENNVKIERNKMTFQNDDVMIELPIKFNPFTGEEVSSTFTVSIEYMYNGYTIETTEETFDYDDFNEMTDEEIEEQIKDDAELNVNINFVNLTGTFSLNDEYTEHDFDVEDDGYSFRDLADILSQKIADDIEVSVTINK